MDFRGHYVCHIKRKEYCPYQSKKRYIAISGFPNGEPTSHPVCDKYYKKKL